MKRCNDGGSEVKSVMDAVEITIVIMAVSGQGGDLFVKIEGRVKDEAESFWPIVLVR